MGVIIGDQKFLTTKEVSQKMGVTQRTVVRWVARQEERNDTSIKFIRHPFSGRILFPNEEIESIVTQLTTTELEETVR